MFDIDVSLARGDFRRQVQVQSDARVLALTGVSGAGKTSLLQAIAGLLRPRAGRIAVAGRTLFDSAERIDLPAHRRHIGFVFQDARLFPHLAVRANLGYGARFAKDRTPRFAFDDVVALLGIAPLLARRTVNLSGGEAQRVAIGRALLSQPDLLLLDEPLASLDQARREELIPYLQRVRDDSGLPMIYVSHVADEVRRMADTVLALDAALR
ncbi:molybdenum ABC transporter ATP-binding protein [Chiayiivirga flava]|uniref:molybdenum ABC transporter ATP-binding protein n=1 Tax=Chiayiivirga flava TaxID=659595 RepID=UPI00161BDDA1